MRRAMSVLSSAAVLALCAGASLSRSRTIEEPVWWSGNVNGTISTVIDGRILGRPIKINRAEGYLSVASGGGAGNTVITLTDGTASCTLTLACATSQTLGLKSFVLGGTCSFPAGASLTSTVTTGGCTTTQPTFKSLVGSGLYL